MCTNYLKKHIEGYKNLNVQVELNNKKKALDLIVKNKQTLEKNNKLEEAKIKKIQAKKNELIKEKSGTPL